VNEQNATMDKIVSVVHGNRDFDPIRFRAKIVMFNFESNIVTTLMKCPFDSNVKLSNKHHVGD